MQILIVDDHLLFAESLRLLLLGTLDADGSVRCANSGAAALEAARQLAPELVLLDWNLGSEPSQEALIEALKTELPEARLVVVSGEAHAEVVRRAIDAGAAGFVPKESTPALLIGALRLIADGAVVAEALVEADDWTRTWSGVASPVRYLRAELIRRNPVIGGWMMLALGNPVFITN